MSNKNIDVVLMSIENKKGTVYAQAWVDYLMELQVY